MRSLYNTRAAAVASLATATLFANVYTGRVPAATRAAATYAAANYTDRKIYHSGQTPGYTAWVGLWTVPDDPTIIMTNFAEAKGPKASTAVFTFPVLQSSNNGANWTRATAGKAPFGFSRGMASMSDGQTMVRTAMTFGSDSVAFGPPGCENVPGPNGTVGYCHMQYPGSGFAGIEVSHDKGLTWGPVSYLVSQQTYTYAVPTRFKPLGDGRVVAVAGLQTRTGPGAAGVQHTMFVGVFDATTNVLRWGPPIPTLPLAAGMCEESDFVELPNGDLFFMHRADLPGIGRHVQSLVTRNKDGSFTPQPPTTTFPNGQFPCLVLTRDGVLLHLQQTSSRVSVDFGATWNLLNLADGTPFTTHYYPRAVQAADGTIVVTSHNSGDDAYMPTPRSKATDEAIWAQTFRLVRGT